MPIPNTPATGGRGWLEKPLWLLIEETKDYVCYRMSLYYYIELLQLLKSTNSGILFFSEQHNFDNSFLKRRYIGGSLKTVFLAN